MTEVAFSSSFKRAYKRRIKGNAVLEARFRERLEAFRSNPFDQTLRTHKLSGRLKDLWSFSVDYDLRIVLSFLGELYLSTSVRTRKFIEKSYFWPGTFEPGSDFCSRPVQRRERKEERR
jgi:mRNA-degrading endonuclease YafQ of YafQ-DinJ toxin-antitoxin module